MPSGLIWLDRGSIFLDTVQYKSTCLRQVSSQNISVDCQKLIRVIKACPCAILLVQVPSTGLVKLGLSCRCLLSFSRHGDPVIRLVSPQGCIGKVRVVPF